MTDNTLSQEPEITPGQIRDKVFVSYSHDDIKWFKLFWDKLSPIRFSRKIIKSHHLTPWSDRDIAPGDDWLQTIDEAITCSAVALLLVSDHYLSSDFVREHELPKLIKAYEADRLKIIWVPINWTLIDEVPELKGIQTSWPLDTPLINIKDEAERDQTVFNTCRAVMSVLTVRSTLDESSCQHFHGRVKEIIEAHGYTFDREFAAGDLSIVYRATEGEKGKAFAVKAVVESPLYPQITKMIAARVRATESLGGSFIRPVNILLNSSPPCLVMEYVSDPKLSDYLRNNGPVDPSIVATIIRQLAYSIWELHDISSGKAIYGSLRPSEIFIKTGNYVRLHAVDFSNELVKLERLRGSVVMSRGLPTYMTPELYFGEPMTPKTDQYSLALLAL